MSLSVQRPTEISTMSDQIYLILIREGCILDIRGFARLAHGILSLKSWDRGIVSRIGQNVFLLEN